MKCQNLGLVQERTLQKVRRTRAAGQKGSRGVELPLGRVSCMGACQALLAVVPCCRVLPCHHPAAVRQAVSCTLPTPSLCPCSCCPSCRPTSPIPAPLTACWSCWCVGLAKWLWVGHSCQAYWFGVCGRQARSCRCAACHCQAAQHKSRCHAWFRSSPCAACRCARGATLRRR